jgi:hypothetical protein
MHKASRDGGYDVVIVILFCGCGGAQPTMSQDRFLGWSQVQEARNWCDF